MGAGETIANQMEKVLPRISALIGERPDLLATFFDHADRRAADLGPPLEERKSLKRDHLIKLLGGGGEKGSRSMGETEEIGRGDDLVDQEDGIVIEVEVVVG